MTDVCEGQEHYAVIGRLMALIQSMSDAERQRLLDVLEERQKRGAAGQGAGNGRKSERQQCLMTVDYTIADRVFRDYIQDISTGGVFIETAEAFEAGEDVVLSIIFSSEQNPFRIPGKVVRTAADGIGVQFCMTSQVQEAIVASIMSDMAPAPTNLD